MTTANNFFIQSTENHRKPKKIVGLVNKILKKAGYSYKLTRGLDPMVDMNTIEQRINFYHLLTSVIQNNVPGEVVELGCFNGQCAVLFQQIIEANSSNKSLHLFDSFEHKFTLSEDVQKALLQNFNVKNLKTPIIHKGLFQDTLKQQLPQKIAFAHIDCGFGGDPQSHKNIMLYCLEVLYNHLSPGAICVLMDYHDPTSGDTGGDYNPGVKMACDEFFIDKPEELISLYGNEVSHAYFRKA